MSFRVEERFTPGPVSKVPVSWFNSVGKFLNNLVGGLGIRVNRDSDPPQIMLDVEKAKLALAIPSLAANTVVQDDGTGDDAEDIAAGAPEAVEQVYMDSSGDADDETDAAKIVRIGVSHFAARADHVHRDPVIHQTRQTLDDMLFIDDDLLYISPPMFDCGGRFIGLDDDSAFAIDIPIGNLDAGSLDGLLSADGSGNISAVSFGTTSGTVAEGDHGHTASDITDWSTATANFLTSADLTNYITSSALATALSGYARSNHTHTISDFTAPGCSATPQSPCFILSDSTNGIYHSNQNPSVATVRAMCTAWTNNGNSFGTGTSNLTHSDITDWSSATSGFLTSSDLSGYVTTSDLSTELAGYVTTGDLQTELAGYVEAQTVSDLADIVDGILSDYLTASDLSTALADYVTDSDLGNYLEESDFPSGFLTAAGNGVGSGTITVVTGVTWNGTSLVYTKQTLSVAKGFVTSLGTSSSQNINTPTVVTWS